MVVVMVGSGLGDGILESPFSLFAFFYLPVTCLLKMRDDGARIRWYVCIGK